MALTAKDPGYRETSDGLQITASLKHGGPPQLLEALTKAVLGYPRQKVLIDLSAQAELDSLGASLLSELHVRAHTAGKDIDLTGSNEAVERGLDRFFFPAPTIRAERVAADPLKVFGEGATSLWVQAGDLLYLTSETVSWTFASLWRGEGHRRGAITAQALAIGVGSLPIVMLISFLIGIVLVMQSAGLLKQFGANIFIADGLVLGMFAEMGPLMTAILLAGRSGASIAAEIATMQVTEEIDALETLALNPIRFIVVPKVWGISLTMPLISLIASVVGVFGGFLISALTLDLTPHAFLAEAVEALRMKDLITGVVKSLVFAWLIVILSAYFGFRVKGGPEAVGKATTQAVVASIFAVIVADAVLGLAFYL